MTLPLTSNDDKTRLTVREPVAGEIERVLHLFGSIRWRRAARLLGAVRSQPIERFIAAAAWWQEGDLGLFRLACQPGVESDQGAGLLIEAVLEVARQVGLATVQYADLLPDKSVWPDVLCRRGFEKVRSERFFEVAYADAWARVMGLLRKHQSEIPPGWRTDPIRQHTPETILEMLTPHRLMPPAEVRHFWQADTAGGFDRELSCILFERDRPFGAFLARRFGEVIYIDVQVVQETNPRLRSLADLCLLYHDAQRVPPDGPLRSIQFRSGEREHRQTANLALRMGGRELPPRHVFARRLRGT
jgi:hypothetical protein